MRYASVCRAPKTAKKSKSKSKETETVGVETGFLVGAGYKG
jgi:hypothetical protein